MVCTFYPRMGGQAFPTLLPTSRQPHPALSLPCCHPGVLAQELLSWEGARRSQIPAWLQGIIHLSDESRGASRQDCVQVGIIQVLLGILGFNGCSSCAFNDGGRALPQGQTQTSVTLTLPCAPHTIPCAGMDPLPSAPLAQPGHSTSSRLFNVPPLAHSSAPRMLSPPAISPGPHVPPKPHILGLSPELAAPQQHFHLVGASGRRIHAGTQQSGKTGLGTPNPAWRIPALPREQAGAILGHRHSSRGTGTAPGLAEGCTVTMRGFMGPLALFWGHLTLFQECCLVHILPCSAPLRAPSCWGGGRAAGHLLRGQGTPPWRP